MKTVVRRDLAIADLVELYAHIRVDSPAASEVFMRRTDEAIARLAEFPHIGRTRGDLGRGMSQVRSCPITGFPNHLVFYIVTKRGIDVLRVLHGARKLKSSLLKSE